MNDFKEFVLLMASGFSGAIVAACMPHEGRTKQQTVVFIVAGMLTSFWITPLFAEWMHVTEPRTISALSFAIGMCWQNVAGKVVEYFNMKAKAKKELGNDA